MPLTKCSECGKDIADDARACPNCGNPLGKNTTVNFGGFFKLLIVLVLLLVIAGTGYAVWYGIKYPNRFDIKNFKEDIQSFFKESTQSLTKTSPERVQTSSGTKTNSQQNVQVSPDTSKTISLQQVNNVGYSFYLGQIDYPNAPSLSDDTKNNITQVIYKSNIPKKLLNNVGIIVVNTLAVSEYQYIKTPTGNIAIPSFGPDFLSGGGIYSWNLSQMSFIFINKTKLGSLSEILTHELAHHVGTQLTSAEWSKYYQLRNIPTGTPLGGQNWNTSPREDFAEVYMNIFTGLPIKTAYGLLLVNTYEVTCSDIYHEVADPYWWDLFSGDNAELENTINQNTKLQNCRREVMSNPDKYPEDWGMLGVPYKSVVDQATKNFVLGIIARLSQ